MRACSRLHLLLAIAVLRGIGSEVLRGLGRSRRAYLARVTGGWPAIFSVLGNIDARIDEINRSRGTNTASASRRPPSRTRSRRSGRRRPFTRSAGWGAGAATRLTSAFVQFGTKDGVTYLYDAHWQGRSAAIVTPVPGADGKYTVRAWIGTGYMNGVDCGATWDGCSYGVLELNADESTRAFELATAGINYGYCGAQPRSDGTDVYIVGSVEGCGAVDTLCVAANDATTSSTGCVAAGLTTFDLPAMGRAATTSSTGGTWPASEYPGGASDTVVLDGTSSDTLHFGPMSPTPGVGRF